MKDFIAIKIRSRQKIHPEFKRVVKQAREALLGLQREIDEEEKRGLDLAVLIERYLPLFEKNIIQLLKNSDRLADSFSDEEHLLHKDFLRDQLGALLMGAPLNHRALKKPLGYAGDYEMMNMIHDPHPFHGLTAFDKLVQAVTCRSISGRLTTARIPYFMGKFEKLGKPAINEHGKFFVMNLACGPSKEVEDFIRTSSLGHQTEFHLIDQDPEAINFSRRRLEAAKEQSGNGVSLFYYPQSIRELFMADSPGRFPRFDLIYSGGLFDYLDDTIFGLAVPFLYGLLAEGGTLIISNISPDDYAKTVKWYLDDWPLIYRTKDDLLKFVPSNPEPREVAIESESTGVNLFLVVRK